MAPRNPEPLDSQELNAINCVLMKFWVPIPLDVEIICPLSGGYLNRNYLINGLGTQFVLRRYDYNPRKDIIVYEHQLLQSLPAKIRRANISKPIATTSEDTVVDLDGNYYALFPYIRGKPFDSSNILLLEEAGRTLAAYHNMVQGYIPTPLRRPRYGNVACLDWVAVHSGGLSDLWKTVAAFPVMNRREQIIHNALDFLAEEAAELQSRLTEDIYATLPQLVIHNDFGPNNLLCQEDYIVGLLDFDLATWDARAYDLATALMWLSEDRALEPAYPILPGDKGWILNVERSKRVFRGYVTDLFPPLTQSEINLLPEFMRSFSLWFAIWYLDRRVAGLDWYPEEMSGLIAQMCWFRNQADDFVAAIVSGAQNI